ncbi:nuclear transport factor 2 family protein [Streptomyces prunicolor]|uniref:nuclear transport factor 2 family protein n=1 Tax=Streptomyces prunicolor TaxID=67348 RepID=UPI00371DE395
MAAEQHGLADRELVLRYFETWNTGDSVVAGEVLHPEWRDHAPPEITGPGDVQRAVEYVQATQSDLRFDISAVLNEGELPAAVGEVSRGAGTAATASGLIWLIRVRDGLLAEIWTHRRDERA